MWGQNLDHLCHLLLHRQTMKVNVSSRYIDHWYFVTEDMQAKLQKATRSLTPSIKQSEKQIRGLKHREEQMEGSNHILGQQNFMYSEDWWSLIGFFLLRPFFLFGKLTMKRPLLSPLCDVLYRSNKFSLHFSLISPSFRVCPSWTGCYPNQFPQVVSTRFRFSSPSISVSQVSIACHLQKTC